MYNQTKNNNLSYLTDPTFIKVNWLFVLSLENEDDRVSFSKCFTPNVEIKALMYWLMSNLFFDTI